MLREVRVGSASRTLTQLEILDPLVGSSLGKIRGGWAQVAEEGGADIPDGLEAGQERGTETDTETDIHIEMDIQEATDT